MKKSRLLLALSLVFAMVLTIIPSGSIAAKKPALSKKSLSIRVGSTKTIKVKNGNAKAKVAWKSSSSTVAKITKKVTKGKKAQATVKGIKEGKAKITAKYKMGGKTKTLTCKVNVSGAESTNTDQLATPTGTNPGILPAQTAAPNTMTPAPSAEPKQEATPEPESNMEPIRTFLEDTDYETPQNYDKVDASTAGQLISITYPSTAVKEGAVVNRNAKVALPKDYTEDKKYPVIYVAHGIGGNENSMPDSNVQNVLWNAVAAGEAEEAIMVFPNCCANETGSSPANFFSVEHYRAYDNFLNDFEQCLKPYIDENYSTLTDRDHTAICGFSMGGRVTLHLGFALQDTFRYIDANCPAPGIFDFTDMGVTDKGLFEKEEFTLKDEYFDDTLVMIVEGDNDTVVHKFPGEYHQALEDNGVPHIHYIRRGGHEASVYNNGIYNFVRRIFKEK